MIIIIIPRDNEMASSAFLHVGQCGSQLGRSFWDTVQVWDQGTYGRVTGKGQELSGFALHGGILPCVVVDTEPKAANSCFGHRSSSHKLLHNTLLTEKAGRGNNWAYGYHGKGGRRENGSDSGDVLTERVREAMRRISEQCDSFMGVVIFHSIAGGTGSGKESSNPCMAMWCNLLLYS